MNNLEVLYTEKNECQDCFKCVKECPVKAVKIQNSMASIVYDLCVYCGHCTEVCPAHAKKIRNDLSRILTDLRNGEKLIVSLAPSYLTEFPNISEDQIVAALKEVGFWGVSETALGAEKIALETKKWLDKQPNGIYIASCCSSTVQYIRKYYPDLTNLLAPVDSPMVAHGKLLKKLYGNDSKVVFIGPCIAKKKESDIMHEVVDYAITFQEMLELFEMTGVDFCFTKPTEEDKFIPHQAGKGNLFPIDGGMIANMISNTDSIDTSFMTFSGEKNITEILNDYETLKKDRKLFLELMFCEGGCIKGPGVVEHKSAATKRIQTIKAQHTTPKEETNNTLELFEDIDISRTFNDIRSVIRCEYSETEIKDALRSVNKLSEKDELNCGGCGYDNCREFARALLDGRAERSMCISFMRIAAYEKTNLIMQRMPYGVVIVDDEMKIVDSNEKFAEILGEDALFLTETNPALRGADITKLAPFHKLFNTVLANGTDLLDQDFRSDDQFLNISIVSIQKNRFALGFIQNLKEPDMQKDLVLKRTRDVITENMKVVQKIAYLLGENASFTETMLNSIVESHDTDDKESNSL